MNAILGCIESVDCRALEGGTYRTEIKLKPRCVMPERKQIPEWLKGQVISITRVVPDPREIGAPGDSIVLTPSESSKYLLPLVVTPPLLRATLRGQILVSLRWWKDKKPPELEVRANGRVRRAKLSKKDDEHEAVVNLEDLFSGSESLPAEVLFECDKLRASCTLFPEDAPAFRRTVSADGESWVVTNRWIEFRVIADTNGAGIASLVERGRNVDHFSHPEDLIQGRFGLSGHIDQLLFGWGDDKLAETSMSSSGARREGGTTRLSFAGTLDKGKGLRTTVSYTAHDTLPLITIQRELLFCDEEKDDKKDAEKKPSEPVDDMAAVSMQFRAAWRADGGPDSGSRVLAVENGRLRSIRCVRENESVRYNTFRLFDGWVIAEHPHRCECMMYLFDGSQGPQIATSLNRNTITLEPSWMHVPVYPGKGCGYVIGLVAGEVCGAADTGAWVACRVPDNRGGVVCCAVAKLRDLEGGSYAEFEIGDSAVTAPLQRLSIPGLGDLAYSAVWLPEGDMRQPLRAIVSGIPGRCGS